jgi:hypothetical protein
MLVFGTFAGMGWVLLRAKARVGGVCREHAVGSVQ